MRTTVQESTIYSRLVVEPTSGLLESGFCSVAQEVDEPAGSRALA